MHRAFSWMAAVEGAGERDQLDEKLVFRWIALNALYGRWNSCNQEPESDSQTLQGFLSVVRDIDHDQLICGCLSENKNLVVSICSDQYVNDYYWRTLNSDKHFNTKRDKYSIEQMYRENSWTLILDELVQRIYLVRCQLVHGAATFGGKLNRDTVRRCGMMLELLLHAIITIVTDHGVTENWDDLCYPPVNAAIQIARKNPR
jgi:hypothetical protein